MQFHHRVCRPMTLLWAALWCGGWGALAAEPAGVRRLEAAVRDLIAWRQAAYAAEEAWAEQRPTLEAQRTLAERQREAAQAAAAARQSELESATASRREAEAAAQRDAEALLRLGAPVLAAEDRLRAMRPLLPEPLARGLGARLAELPEAAAPVTMENLADRLRLVFGLLTEIEQFADGIHLAREHLSDPAGETRELEVLYLGLGTAFAVSPGNETAAVGTPTPAGWSWRWHPELAGRIRSAIAIFRKERPATFVSLPLEHVPPASGGTP